MNGSIFEPMYGKQESAVFDFYGQNNSWLGITDQGDEGKFKYYSNSKQVGYSNWSEEEPNSDGNCVVSVNGTWSDQNCTEGNYQVICQEKTKGYICPKDPGWSLINGRCFYISDDILKWKRAKKKCISMSARLFEPK